MRKKSVSSVNSDITEKKTLNLVEVIYTRNVTIQISFMQQKYRQYWEKCQHRRKQNGKTNKHGH